MYKVIMTSSGCLQGTRTMVIIIKLLLVLIGVTANADAAAAIEDTEDIIIDAENGGICIDIDTKNCPYWAATNQCIENKSFMNINCKLSCKRCNIVRVNNHNDINSYIAEKKKELEYKRSEQKKLKESLTILAAETTYSTDPFTDNNNEDMTTTTTTTPTATAKTTITGELLQQEELNSDDDTTNTTTDGSIDDNDDHNDNTKEEEEEQQQTTVVSGGSTTTDTTTATATTTKTKTKSTTSTMKEKEKEKKIIIDADTGLECRDQDEKNCPYWSITGECKKNRTWMHTNCKKSCNRCHVVRVNTQNDINTIISQKNKEAKEKHNVQRKKLDSLRILSSSSSQGEL